MKVEVTDGPPEPPAAVRTLSALEVRAEELHREDHPFARESAAVWCPRIDECFHTGHDRPRYLLFAKATLDQEAARVGPRQAP